MNITEKLVMQVNEQLEHELMSYERIMKHEIYRIAGVFKKEQRAFHFRYRNISDEISWFSKSLVVEQAKLFYEMERKGKHPTLDFSSMWSKHSYNIDDSGLLLLELGVSEQRKILKVPFYVHEQQLQNLKMGELKEMIIKHRGDDWFAFVTISMQIPKKKDGLPLGIDLGNIIPLERYPATSKE